MAGGTEPGRLCHFDWAHRPILEIYDQALKLCRSIVKGWFSSEQSWRVSGLGAALAVLAGLLLWWTPLGDDWVNTSYDYLFRFGARPVTNNVTLILMDNGALDAFGQTRGQPWDRALHTRLLNRLADDGCEMVVFDSFFHALRDPAKDDALAAAMRRQKHVVLMAEQSELEHPAVEGAEPNLPAGKFLAACGTNWGVGWFAADDDDIVRRQWPFPSPGPYPSLPWTAAKVMGKPLSSQPEERWVRYYGQAGPWTRMSYQYALTEPTNYFRNQIVFIGNWPENSAPAKEADKFSTPYTRWTDEACGGVQLLVTVFLNLLDDDSLLRPPPVMELGLFVVTGVLLGGGLCRLRTVKMSLAAAGLGVAISLLAVLLSYYTNYWFPWLVAVGGQLPCAVGWAVAVNVRRALATAPISTTVMAPAPTIPGYTLIQPPFGEGAYGKVWLARTGDQQWRAVKAVYAAQFGEDPGPYEREFKGVKIYQPISSRHPGLLRVEMVSEKRPDHFYYVMELGDALEPGWESKPAAYRPRDLFSGRAQLHKRRLPVEECLRVGVAICEALEFLHGQGITHRDIKPQNIIFVNGQPKLADVGLITEIKPDSEERTLVGTPGYMPPAPERPGTVAADIYALGMVLYVLATGRGATHFPEVATTLVSTDRTPDYLPLNQVILKACDPTPTERYATAAEMRTALEVTRQAIAELNGQ